MGLAQQATASPSQFAAALTPVATANRQQPRCLHTVALKRGEGEFRAADERCAERHGPFDGCLGPRRLGAAPFGGEGAAVAVEFAHDFDHLVDRLEVCARHGAEGDQQRLVETADLNGHELLGRVRHAAGQNLADERAHPLLADTHPRRDLGDRHAAVEIFDNPLFALEFRQARGARVR